MKEKDFISIIKTSLNSEYIGDDCAYLKDLGIVITQDSLVEGVHFSLDFITPYQLGYKSIMVNLSDIAASGAEPKYLTVSLSLPRNTNKNFVEDFYNGAKDACGENIKIVGGDITGGDKVFVSVCAIGACGNRKISSRKNAKIGYKIVVMGNHGSSFVGLNQLLNKDYTQNEYTQAHLQPKAFIDFGKEIGSNITQNYAMMDTSDGIMDAFSTIANESNVLFEIDFDKIPHSKNIELIENWQKFVLYGGEDYGIVAAIPQDIPCFGTVVGEVKEGLGIDLKINGETVHYTKKEVENNCFNHFGG